MIIIIKKISKWTILLGSTFLSSNKFLFFVIRQWIIFQGAYRDEIIIGGCYIIIRLLDDNSNF